MHKVDLFESVLIANDKLALVDVIETNFVLAVARAFAILNLVEKVHKCKCLPAAGQLQQILKHRVCHELEIFAKQEAFMEDWVLKLVGFFVNET
jgi:hypothetical protein